MCTSLFNQLELSLSLSQNKINMDLKLSYIGVTSLKMKDATKKLTCNSKN